MWSKLCAEIFGDLVARCCKNYLGSDQQKLSVTHKINYRHECFSIFCHKHEDFDQLAWWFLPQRLKISPKNMESNVQQFMSTALWLSATMWLSVLGYPRAISSIITILSGKHLLVLWFSQWVISCCVMHCGKHSVKTQTSSPHSFNGFQWFLHVFTRKRWKSLRNKGKMMVSSFQNVEFPTLQFMMRDLSSSSSSQWRWILRRRLRRLRQASRAPSKGTILVWNAWLHQEKWWFHGDNMEI